MSQMKFSEMLKEMGIPVPSATGTRYQPRDTNDMDKMTGQNQDPSITGTELSDEDMGKLGDMDNADLDLDGISIDMIIAALQALKAQMAGDTSIGADDECTDPGCDHSECGFDPDCMDDMKQPEQQMNGSKVPFDELDGRNGNGAVPGDVNAVAEPEDEQLGGHLPGAGMGIFKDFKKLPDARKTDIADPSGQMSAGGEEEQMDPTQGPAEGTDPLDVGMNPAMEDPTNIDPNKQGDIRQVAGAHLVYKRQDPDGTFEELWVFNIGEHINDSLAIKKAIVAGTDIPEGKMRSEDGIQSYDITVMGNAQMVHIRGLPN